MSFHRFNPLTGRITQTSQSQALYPLSPRPLDKTEPLIMYDTNKTKPVTTPGSKNYSSSPLAKIWKVQKEFQADPEKPTYLLRGKTDKMLLGINAGIAAVSFLVNMYFMNELRKKYTQ